MNVPDDHPAAAEAFFGAAGRGALDKPLPLHMDTLFFKVAAFSEDSRWDLYAGGDDARLRLAFSYSYYDATTAPEADATRFGDFVTCPPDACHRHESGCGDLGLDDLLGDL